MTQTLGPYELRGELGRGAMAIVWRAFDTKLEREVALKEPMLPAGIDEAAASEMGARFVREGKAAAGLNHPGIVTIYAADVYEGRPAIVMELIEGETLSDVLSRGALPPGAALAITDQLLDAAGYAHARGVVHRDIKPDNVFVTNDGRVKLADFGIAHVGTTAALTQAGTVMGTPGYMAPEQVTGQSVDARADLFAIGVLAHEMLSGSNPFGATDGVAPTTAMYRIVHEQMPQLPPVVLSGLPPHLTAVLGTATAKDPGDRFGDAQAFRAALAGGAIVTAPGRGVLPAISTVTPESWGAAAPIVTAATATSPSLLSRHTALVAGAAVGLVVVAIIVALVSSGPTAIGTDVPRAISGGPAAPTPPPAATPEQDRAAIIALCDAYLEACASDNVRAGYDLHSSGYRRANSYEEFSGLAMRDADLGRDGTPFIRGFVGMWTNTALAVDPEVVKFLTLDSTSAQVSYEGMYGTEAFFGFEMSLTKESGAWRIERCKMQSGSGA